MTDALVGWSVELRTGSAAASSVITVRGLKRTSANSTATANSSGSASTSSARSQLSSHRHGNTTNNNTSTSNASSHMNATSHHASNQQQQGARLKRTYSAMNNVAAGSKTTIHMPVKVRPLPQSLISPHPIINSLIDAP